MMSIKARYHVPLEFLHGVARAQNRQAQRMVLPETLCENFMDEIIGIILVHLYLFQNDAALLRDIAAIKNGMKDEIAEHIHGDRKMLIEYFNVKADTFLGCKSIHIAANRIHLTGDGFSGAGFRALKHHV